ncbi:MAG: recombinase family protein [Lachnospiraceae bacterium]|nr:recombinase family protein [Lachnospiraceae bacterium]MDE6253532.1 recombinase family protein [Lachnospiraceae bacterium]
MRNGKVAGYYRLSIEDDDVQMESNSITNQRTLVKKFIMEDKELSQYEFCEFYDDGYSGTTMDRPGIQELLNEIRNNQIHVVIVKDISRFSRDYIELGTYMEQIFPFLGIRFIAITDHYDSMDYIGCTVDVNIAFKSLLADFYCKDVSDKVKSSVEAKKKQGKYAMGCVPFGYSKDKNNTYNLIIVQDEAEVVRYIFQLSYSGKNLTQICRILNDEGILTPLEFINLRKKQNRKELKQQYKLWQAGTVRSILTNETYIGHMVYGKTEQTAVGSGKKILKPKEEWKVFKNHHEAIVDKEIFDAVQKKFNKVKNNIRKNIQYPLKGKLFCRYCKRTLKVMRLAEEKLSFYCASGKICSDAECISKTINNEELEGVVLSELKNQLIILGDKNIIMQHSYIRKKEGIKEEEKNLKCLENQLKELTNNKALLLENYHTGILNKEQYKDKKNEITYKLSELQLQYEKEENEIKKQREEINDFPMDVEEIFRYSGMDCLCRDMVETFIKRIEIDGYKNIDIYWTFNNH